MSKTAKTSKTQTAKTTNVAKRGFASLTPERQREIASKGGKSVPAEKRSFSQDRNLAARAGQKGGSVVRRAA